ncbi:MAG: KpsF/GutQ family sugar-phosphate isomerase [bacterium]
MHSPDGICKAQEELHRRVISSARRVLEIESRAIGALVNQVGPDFASAVSIIFRCQGKVIVSGVGKSGHVGRKIASTLASTGTPSFFLHPVEGVHGDLGMATPEDVFLFVSHSGSSQEVLQLVPFVKRLGCPVISITGRRDSPLAKASDAVVLVEVEEEACPLGLAPTASTTSVLAMGDAMALSLLELKGFTPSDFAKLHPGGSLGKRLLLRVGDLMHTGEGIPLVHESTCMRDAILEITSKGLGVTGVVDDEGRLVGVITDGDLRRGLQRGNQMLEEPASRLMTRNPKCIQAQALAVDALNKMQRHAITSLFVFDGQDERAVSGIIHLHDVLRAGVL